MASLGMKHATKGIEAKHDPAYSMYRPHVPSLRPHHPSLQSWTHRWHSMSEAKTAVTSIGTYSWTSD